MTAYKQIEVGCDGSDGDCEAEPGGRAATVAEARAIARAHGWVYKGRKDYCPEHADGQHGD